MKVKEIAKRIKELRTRKGFSQDELSEKSGLSIRTIQRIENGETEPRGDSLKRLALAFNISPEEIMDCQIVENKNFIILMNLSQLSYLVHPFLGIVAPLVIWITKKDKIKDLDKTGKSIINFQITWTIAFFIAYYFGPYFSILEFVDIRAVFYGFNLLMILVNSYRIYNLKETYYRPALKILR